MKAKSNASKEKEMTGIGVSAVGSVKPASALAGLFQNDRNVFGGMGTYIQRQFPDSERRHLLVPHAPVLLYIGFLT